MTCDSVIGIGALDHWTLPNTRRRVFIMLDLEPARVVIARKASSIRGIDISSNLSFYFRPDRPFEFGISSFAGLEVEWSDIDLRSTTQTSGMKSLKPDLKAMKIIIY